MVHGRYREIFSWIVCGYEIFLQCVFLPLLKDSESGKMKGRSVICFSSFPFCSLKFMS